MDWIEILGKNKLFLMTLTSVRYNVIFSLQLQFLAQMIFSLRVCSGGQDGEGREGEGKEGGGVGLKNTEMVK